MFEILQRKLFGKVPVWLVSLMFIICVAMLIILFAITRRGEVEEPISPVYEPPTVEEVIQSLLESGYVWAGELEYGSSRWDFYATDVSVRIVAEDGVSTLGKSVFTGDTPFEFPDLSDIQARQLVDEDRLFYNVWEYSDAAFVGQLKFLLDGGWQTELRVRTLDYMEYVLTNADGSQCVRLFAGGGKLMCVPVDGAFTFDIGNY